MTSDKLGIEITDNLIRVARIETEGASIGAVDLRSMARGTESWHDESIKGQYTLVVPDEQAIVRIVQTAEVDPAATESAARYEAESALLARGNGLRTIVTPISVAEQNNQWLAVSVHSSVLENLVGQFTRGLPQANSLGYLPRSLAMGHGYLESCDTTKSSSAIVVAPQGARAAVCFVCRGTIVGTAQMRGIDPLADDQSRLAHWTQELRMVAKYRLSSDLAEYFATEYPAWVMLANDDAVRRTSAVSELKFLPPEITLPDRLLSAGSAKVTPEWMIALGAALN